MSDVNQELLKLLSQVTTTSPGCFYNRLDDRGREFVDACMEVRKSGRHVSVQKISDVLGREFKVQVSESSVRRHIKEACTCPKNETETK